MSADSSKTEYTPGPWFTSQQGRLTIYIESRIGGGMIQEVAACGPTVAGRDQQEANARLIAAAPALVEALKKSLTHFESQHKLPLHIGSPPFVQLRQEMIAALRAAGVELP